MRHASFASSTFVLVDARICTVTVTQSYETSPEIEGSEYRNVDIRLFSMTTYDAACHVQSILLYVYLSPMRCWHHQLAWAREITRTCLRLLTFDTAIPH